VRKLCLIVALAFTALASTGRAESNRAAAVAVGFGNYQDRIKVNDQFLILDEALNRRVAEIGQRLTNAADGAQQSFTFRIVNSPVVNAYATTGGYVYLNAGLIELVGSTDELAAAMAHEIAHNNKSHVIAQIERAEFHQSLVELGQVVLAIGFVGAGAYGQSQGVFSYVDYPGLAGLGFAGGGLIGFTLSDVMLHGYAKDDEIEADRIAVSTLIAAGYDPYGMIRLFKRFQEVRDRAVTDRLEYESALINKQPGIEKRIERWIKEVQKRQGSR